MELPESEQWTMSTIKDATLPEMFSQLVMQSLRDLSLVQLPKLVSIDPECC